MGRLDLVRGYEGEGRSAVERHAVQHEPLLSLEVQRIRAAFSGTADELAVARRRVGDLDLGTVGPPACDAAVGTGLGDLRSGLGRLESTSQQCVAALARHLPDLTAGEGTAGSSAGTAADAVQGSSDAG